MDLVAPTAQVGKYYQSNTIACERNLLNISSHVLECFKSATHRSKEHRVVIPADRVYHAASDPQAQTDSYPCENEEGDGDSRQNVALRLYLRLRMTMAARHVVEECRSERLIEP